MLGIENPAQIIRDPLVGNIFENLIVIECLKTRYNQGKLANLYFYRDSNGNEVDIIFQSGRNLTAMECKSSSTYSASLFKALDKFNQFTAAMENAYVVYNGEPKTFSNNKKAIRFDQVRFVVVSSR